ncbi:MAG: hypothetical protein SGJ24_13370 [Chloroflexota bacterium]|nr:hypothetical protein [Chloroflexota bacterium]
MADLLSHEAPAHQANDLPLVLPPKLIGRDKTLGQVYTLLKQTKPVLLYGAAGIGKTAFAATLARAYCELPGGVLWLAVNRSPLAELIARIGRAYDVPDLARSENPIGLVGLAMSTLTQNKPLIVLDGAIDIDATTEFIMRCADRVPVLVVTDSDTDIAGPWTSVTLPRLERADSESLFRQVAPGASLDRLASLLDVLDDVPLALITAAGAVRLAGMTPGDFQTIMPARPGVPSALLALTAAYSKLNGAQQGLLLLLGAAPRQGATGELMSMVGGAPEAAIEGVLNALIDARLVEKLDRAGKAYYRLHPLVGAFAISWLRGKGRLETLQNNMREALLRYVEKHSAARADDALIAEMDNLIATAQAGAESGRRADAERISLALMQAGSFINARGYVYEFLTLRQLGIGTSSVFPAHQAAAVQSPLPFEVPVTVSPFAAPPTVAIDEVVEDSGEENGEDDDEALIEDDRVVADLDYVEEETDEPAELFSIASTLNTFTSGAFDEEEFDDEEEDHLDLLDIDDEDDDLDADDDLDEDDEDTPIRMSSILDSGDFGSTQFESASEMALTPGIPSAALSDTAPISNDPVERMRYALVKARQSGNRREQADLLGNIAQEQVVRGLLQEAISTYSEALTVYEALEDNPGQLSTLERLTTLEAQIDESAPAVLHAASGARLARDLNNETIERRMLTLLGDAHVQLGEGEDGVRAFTDALDLARTAGDALDEGDLLLKLGYAQMDTGDAEGATERFEDALTRFRTQNRRDKEGLALAALGMASAELERWTEAINFYTSALYIAREVHNRRDELQQLTNMGFAHIQSRDLGKAVLRYRQALHLAFDLDDDEEIVAITVELARMLVESPRHIEIAAMLVDAGLLADGSARDLRRLKDRIDDERPEIDNAVINVFAVTGTARDYARNAYSQLDEV